MKFLVFIALGLTAVSGEESTGLENFASGNAQFTSALYKVLSESNPGNFLVCPLSIQIVLALAHAGAQGNTAKELADGICLPDDQGKIQAMVSKLAPYLQVNDNYTLTSANKLYLTDRYKLRDEFKSTALNIFGAESENVDFTKSQQTANAINKWVEERTYHKIKDLISADVLDGYTIAVLVNAMYFKANWLQQFDPRLSHKSEFYVDPTNKVPIDFMSTRTYLNYYESDKLNAQFVELPYEGHDTSMILVLPKQGGSLASLEGSIADVLAAPKFEQKDVEIMMPRFKMGTKIPLKPVLKELGVKDAFNDDADFSKLCSTPAYISEVLQKTFIEVSEKGTTAAASTAVVFSTRTGPERVAIANHPFLFYLKHRVAGVFFIGRYVNPENTALKIE